MKNIKRNFAFVLLLFANLVLAGCGTIGVLALNQLELSQLAVENEKLYLLGTLNSKTLEQFEQVMSDYPDIKTVVLTANDGSIDDETTFRLGRNIRQRGLDTYLLHNSIIASGAVDLFLSGVNRTMEHGAQVGVHSWSDGTNEAKDLSQDHPDHRLNADYIRDMLSSEDFYWYTIYSAAADAIHWMRDEEIHRFDLATVITQPTQEQPPFRDQFLSYRESILMDN